MGQARVVCGGARGLVRVRERRERVMGLRMTERGGEAGSDAQGCSGVRGAGARGGGSRERACRIRMDPCLEHDWSVMMCKIIPRPE